MRQPFPYNVADRGYMGDPRRGSSMGRPSVGESHNKPVALSLRPVPLDQGYDGGGVYWGDRPRGVRLYCAFSRGRDVVRYVDGSSQREAIGKVRDDFPAATFKGEAALPFAKGAIATLAEASAALAAGPFSSDSRATILTGAPALAYLGQWAAVLEPFDAVRAVAVFSRLDRPVQIWATSDGNPDNPATQWERL